ncbi:hypothetical protein [Streptomyces orinoci]|uniref:proton-translocating NAD(P)(+) transhydrogenase n=1 Tax=Streptomyces orinoci TaxID=67339 RepID=A0ABV3K4D4_STRON|nr:hypothetical protein [Streptomyces orinoci]
MTVSSIPPERSGPFQRIGLAAEHASPEDPEGTETRVALTPDGVAALVRHGLAVTVETGAGRAMGFPDAAYRSAGAAIQDRDALYRHSDLVIKLNGPAHEDLWRMTPGATLLCMAHVRSVPMRAAVANARGINLLAMELIDEHPEVLTDSYVRSQLAMRRMLDDVPPGLRSAGELDVCFAGFTPEVFGALQYVARCGPRTLHMSQPGLPGYVHPVSVSFAHQGRTVGQFTLDEISSEIAAAAMGEFRAGYPARLRGDRKIHCLHETGRAGALFGIELALRKSPAVHTVHDIRVCILGYGRVAFGALDECMRHGIAKVDILTRRDTCRPAVRRYLRNSDLIINGVELGAGRTGVAVGGQGVAGGPGISGGPGIAGGEGGIGREDGTGGEGGDYIITNGDLMAVLRRGTVIIDLVGGSVTKRTAVQPVVDATHPGEPHSVRNGVYLASVWDWPVLGFRQESVERYSRQIVQVLLHDERLVNGLGNAPANITRALVAGPVLARAVSHRSSQQVALSATLRA